MTSIDGGLPPTLLSVWKCSLQVSAGRVEVVVEEKESLLSYLSRRSVIHCGPCHKRLSQPTISPSTTVKLEQARMVATVVLSSIRLPVPTPHTLPPTTTTTAAGVQRPWLAHRITISPTHQFPTHCVSFLSMDAHDAWRRQRGTKACRSARCVGIFVR